MKRMRALNSSLSRLNIVIYILIANAVIAIAYLVARIIKKDHERGIIMSIFMILAPVVGVLYLFVSWAMFEIYFKRRAEEVNLEDLSMSKDKIEILKRNDIQQALNKVPIEEALIISDSKDTRRLLLDVFKDDREKYINSIYQATESEDGEVSHYAASAITDIIDKFKKKEKLLNTEYDKDKKDKEIGKEYWEYLSEFLMNKVLSPVEQERYARKLEMLIKKLEDNVMSVVTGELYYRMVLIFIALENLDRAELIVAKALKYKNKDLESYKAGLKLYYKKGEIEKLSRLVGELMDSPVRLDNETLEFIRFYKR